MLSGGKRLEYTETLYSSSKSSEYMITLFILLKIKILVVSTRVIQSNDYILTIILYLFYMLDLKKYPKKARLKSRWYAHPAFPIILQLGGDIIIRSNWKQYLEEFRLSVLYCSEAFKKMKQDNPSIMMEEMIITSYVDSVDKSDSILLVPFDESFVPMTNFEKKYFSCGERFYELSMIDSNKNKLDVDEK